MFDCGFSELAPFVPVPFKCVHKNKAAEHSLEDRALKRLRASTCTNGRACTWPRAAAGASKVIPVQTLDVVYI